MADNDDLGLNLRLNHRQFESDIARIIKALEKLGATVAKVEAAVASLNKTRVVGPAVTGAAGAAASGRRASVATTRDTAGLGRGLKAAVRKKESERLKQEADATKNLGRELKATVRAAERHRVKTEGLNEQQIKARREEIAASQQAAAVEKSRARRAALRKDAEAEFIRSGAGASAATAAALSGGGQRERQRFVNLRRQGVGRADALAQVGPAATQRGLSNLFGGISEAAEFQADRVARAVGTTQTNLKNFSGGVASSMRSATRAARRGSDGVVSSFQRLDRRMVTITERIRGTIFSLRFALTTALGGAAVKNAVSFAADFEEALSQVNTLLDDSLVPLERYEQQLLSLSQRSSKQLIDVTKALYQTISGGIPTIEGSTGAFAVTEAAVKAAEAGLSTTEEAVNALVTTMNSFGAEVGSASEASDKLFETVRKGRVVFPELSTVLGKILPTAKAFGVSIDETLAALAALTRSGLSASEAGIALQQLLIGLVRPSEKAARAFAAVGIEASAAAIAENGLLGQLQAVRDATGGNADAIKTLIREKRALRAIIPLTGSVFEDFRQITDDVATSTGATDEALSKVESNLNRVGRLLVAVFEAVQAAAAEGALPKLVEFFEELSQLLIRNQDAIKSFVEGAVDVFIGSVRFLIRNGEELLTILHALFVGSLVRRGVAAFTVLSAKAAGFAASMQAASLASGGFANNFVNLFSKQGASALARVAGNPVLLAGAALVGDALGKSLGEAFAGTTIEEVEEGVRRASERLKEAGEALDKRIQDTFGQSRQEQNTLLERALTGSSTALLPGVASTIRQEDFGVRIFRDRGQRFLNRGPDGRFSGALPPRPEVLRDERGRVAPRIEALPGSSAALSASEGFNISAKSIKEVFDDDLDDFAVAIAEIVNKRRETLETFRAKQVEFIGIEQELLKRSAEAATEASRAEINVRVEQVRDIISELSERIDNAKAGVEELQNRARRAVRERETEKFKEKIAKRNLQIIQEIERGEKRRTDAAKAASQITSENIAKEVALLDERQAVFESNSAKEIQGLRDRGKAAVEIIERQLDLLPKENALIEERIALIERQRDADITAAKQPLLQKQAELAKIRVGQLEKAQIAVNGLVNRFASAIDEGFEPADAVVVETLQNLEKFANEGFPADNPLTKGVDETEEAIRGLAEAFGEVRNQDPLLDEAADRVETLANAYVDATKDTKAQITEQQNIFLAAQERITEAARIQIDSFVRTIREKTKELLDLFSFELVNEGIRDSIAAASRFAESIRRNLEADIADQERVLNAFAAENDRRQRNLDLALSQDEFATAVELRLLEEQGATEEELQRIREERFERTRRLLEEEHRIRQEAIRSEIEAAEKQRDLAVQTARENKRAAQADLAAQRKQLDFLGQNATEERERSRRLKAINAQAATLNTQTQTAIKDAQAQFEQTTEGLRLALREAGAEFVQAIDAAEQKIRKVEVDLEIESELDSFQRGLRVILGEEGERLEQVRRRRDERDRVSGRLQDVVPGIGSSTFDELTGGLSRQGQVTFAELRAALRQQLLDDSRASGVELPPELATEDAAVRSAQRALRGRLDEASKNEVEIKGAILEIRNLIGLSTDRPPEEIAQLETLLTVAEAQRDEAVKTRVATQQAFASLETAIDLDLESAEIALKDAIDSAFVDIEKLSRGEITQGGAELLGFSPRNAKALQDVTDAAGVFGDLFNFVKGFPDLLRGIGEFLRTGIYDFLSDLFTAIGEFLFSLVEGLPEQVARILEEGLPALIEGIVDKADEFIEALILAIPRLASALTTAIFEGVPKIITAIVTVLPGALVEGVVRAFSRIRLKIPGIGNVSGPAVNIGAGAAIGAGIGLLTGTGPVGAGIGAAIGGGIGLLGSIFHQGGMIGRGLSNPAAASAFASAGAQRFAGGGVVQPAGSATRRRVAALLSGDDVPILAQAGEGVLTAAGVNAIGGEGALNAANRGISPGGANGGVNIQFRGRGLDAIMGSIVDSVAVDVASARGRTRREIVRTRRAPLMTRFVKG